VTVILVFIFMSESKEQEEQRRISSGESDENAKLQRGLQ
jgi:hypothetical protein